MELSYISPKVVGNICTVIQALCAPRSDCGMDGHSRLLRRETGVLLPEGESITTGGKPNTMGSFSIRILVRRLERLKEFHILESKYKARNSVPSPPKQLYERMLPCFHLSESFNTSKNRVESGKSCREGHDLV